MRDPKLASPAARFAFGIYQEVLKQVRGDELVRKHVRLVGDILFLQDSAYDLGTYDRIFLVGAGKASVAMVSALLELLGDRVSGGLVVTKDEPNILPASIRVIYGGHPLPNESSLLAGGAMLELAGTTTPNDLVIMNLSGGASSLLEAPRHGVTIDDLRRVNDLLLQSGAPIQTINEVRRQLSSIKAGRLARAFVKGSIQGRLPTETWPFPQKGSDCAVLVMSDVLGNDVATIGSGPFTSPKSNKKAAHQFALAYEDQLSKRVHELLIEPEWDLPIPSVPHFVIGSASLLLPLATPAAEARELAAFAYGDPLIGEASVQTAKILELLKAKIARGEDNFCMIFVGETTVTNPGIGFGGRCAEMALAAADAISKMPGVAFLAAGTDGSDGPTPYAGGIVETSTVTRTERSVDDDLLAHDSYRYLEAVDGVIETGPTASNLNDIVLVVRTP